MHLRPALPTDLPTITTISALCFTTDPLYTFTNPGHEIYPLCFRNFLLLRHKIRFYTPGWRYIVAVTDEEEEGEEDDGTAGEVGQVGQVVGYIVFYREVEERSAYLKRQWFEDSVGNFINRTLLNLQNHYTDLLRLDRSHSPANVATYHRLVPKEYPSGDLIQCRNLCTHPAWQRRGIGGMLVRWGIERAKEEGVMVGLAASPMGTKMYKREGFREIAFYDAGEAGGVPVLVWDGEEKGEVERQEEEEEKEREK